MICVEVLGDCAVIHVTESYLLVVTSCLLEKVLQINQVDVANLLHALLLFTVFSGRVNRINTAFCDLTSDSLLLSLLDIDRKWIEVALLSLEAETHLKVMEVFIVLGTAV